MAVTLNAEKNNDGFCNTHKSGPEFGISEQDIGGPG